MGPFKQHDVDTNCTPLCSPFNCAQCGEIFGTDMERKMHVANVHQDEVAVPGMDSIARVNGTFQCPNCPYQDPNPYNFRRHSHIMALKKAEAIQKQPGGQLKHTRSASKLLGNPSTSAVASPAASASNTPLTTVTSLPTAPPSLHPSPALLSVPLTHDDPTDPDYQAMDVEEGHLDFNARELIRPEALRALQLGIDPDHRLVVCEGCHCGLQRSTLHNHLIRRHGGVSNIPVDMDSILDSYQVPMHITPPPSRVSPIQSIPLKNGFICQVDGCGFAGENSRSIHCLQPLTCGAS